MAGSNVEQIKGNSRGLRGTILQTLLSDATHFSDEDNQLLKFHGAYQQDDRDQRSERKQAGLEKAWIFMVRTKLPGGDLSAEKYLAMDRLADEVGNGTLRITTRQGIQFHGVLKNGLRECISRINRSGILTWGACGDVVRNTMAPASPLHTPAHQDAHRLAREISDAFLARSRAYAEIWINGEKLEANASASDENEPVYGRYYLPRKFKFGIVIPPRNDADIYTQDAGFITHAPNGPVEGYTVVAGGSFGMTHGMVRTFPALAKPLFYVQREHAVAAAVAIVTAQRDHGRRDDRRRARLKYLIDERGIDWFRTEVRSRLNVPIDPPRAVEFTTVADMLGWHEQGDGRIFCGLWVENGRIRDTETARYRSGFRAIAERFGFPVRLTPNCNLICYNIESTQKPAVDEALAEFGIPHSEGLTEARKTSHACVALPTCGLALAESERAFPSVMNEMDGILWELKLENEPILIRMSGCPNGCSRPYNADIALVGRSPGRYALYVGGSYTGDRLAGLERKGVDLKDIPSVVRSYLQEFAIGRRGGESFTAFWGRTRPTGMPPAPELFHLERSERAARLAAAGQKASAE
ncbi:MAG: NADPH-dependent assimilatory sulfite reductase hemoprotein subunit [Verrucomicrobia bacterium]|nr:NADPH-dependent assimilatory sulfite reductase hemoprotein subunit [Verrucomicrobiota bacterium]